MNPLGHITLVYFCLVSIAVSAQWTDDNDFESRQVASHWGRNRGWHHNHVLAGIDDIRPVSSENCSSDVLSKNPHLSSAVECARTCRDGEPSKTCYYHFVVEHYPIAGRACELCRPTKSDMHCNGCQCVEADGIERTAMIVNRMLPGPSIEVCKGDRIVVDVENRLKGSAVTIHWHGILQKGSQYFDGVPFVTQCPISEGNTFRYQYDAGNVGTHFWHAHTGLHKMDGVYGPLIVREPPKLDVNRKLYDYDLSKHIVLVSDWMHEMAIGRYPGRIRSDIGQRPDSILINGRGQYTNSTTGQPTNVSLEVFEVKPNSRYRFRLINSFCTTCPSSLTIEGHRLTIITTDGMPVQPIEVDTIVSFAGERYDFIIKTGEKIENFWIQLRALGACGENRTQQLAILRYQGASKSEEMNSRPAYDTGLSPGVVLNPLDAICHEDRQDAVCVSNLKSAIPIDKGILKDKADIKIYLPIKFYQYELENLFRPNSYKNFLVPNGGSHQASVIDGIAFEFPNAPLLSQLEDVPKERFCNWASMPKSCEDTDTACSCIHNVNIPRDAIAEVVLVDEFQVPNISHPFHLHGYAPYVIGMGRSPDTNVTKISLAHAMDLDRRNLLTRCFDLPPAKDTIAVPNNGYVILRFRASNPGFWLLHCHFIYHQAVGMDMLLRVGEQSDLPPVPHQFPKCGNYMPPIKRSRHPPGTNKSWRY